jgi:hypothetical protein
MELKNIYRGDEVKFAAMFRALQPALLAEFLAAHPDFFSNKLLDEPEYPIQVPGTSIEQRKLWKAAGIKWKSLTGPLPPSIKAGLEKNQAKYPVAYELATAFGDNCPVAGFSIAEPGCVIYRHTDVPDRHRRTISVHVPLYIPKGDIGFEVEGEVSTWDDVFSFNNQKLHGVWNNTDERRLIFIIQLSRTFCGLPLADWTSPSLTTVPVFEKTRDPNYKPLTDLL